MTSPEEMSFELERVRSEVKRLQSLANQQAEKLGALSAQATAADKRAVAVERDLTRERHNADVEIKALRERVHRLTADVHGEQALREEAEAKLARSHSAKLPRFQVTEAEWSTALKLGQPGINYVCLDHVNAILARRPADDEASAEQLRAALAECVWAMETWGSWEDGVPASDEGGEHGRVGVAYDTARMLLGYADDGKRTAALLRPAADVVKPMVCTLEQAQRIEQTSGMGPFACTAYQLRDAINAELRPATDEAALPQAEPVPGAAPRFQVTEAEWSTALKLGQPGINYVCLYHVNAVLASRPSTDEAEALRKSLACSRDRMRVTAERLDAADRHIADIEGELGEVRDYCAERGQDRDERAVTAVTAVVSWLESQLASVTEEREEYAAAARQKWEEAYKLAIVERDEALAKLAKAEREASSVVCALDDAGVPGVVGVDGPVLDCVDKPAAVVGETCGSPGRVKWLANQLEFYRKSTEHAEKLIEQLREQLAARPEPVVLDEALAERVLLELEQGQAHPGDLSRGYIQVALAALRRHLGDRASVSVPQGDPYAGIANEDLTDEQLAEASRSPDERLIARLNADLAYSRKTLDGVLEQRDQLRAELEETRAALAATQGELEDALGNRDLQQLRDELTDCKSRLEGYERSNRELRDKWNAELREVGRLGLELKEARSGLEACKRAHDRADLELHWLDDQVFQSVYANPGEKLREMIKAIRDLLKPAPQGELQLIDQLVDRNSPAFLQSKLEATEEIAAGLRAELEAYRATIRTLASEVVDLSEQHDALRAELEAARKTVHEIAIHLGCVDWSDGGRFVQAPDDRIIAAAGEAAGWKSSYGMYKELSERHDALRAACTLTGEEQDMLLDDEPRRVLEQLGARIEAALLKPAPAQYHPNDLDDVDGDVSQLDEPGRRAPSEADPVIVRFQALAEAERMLRAAGVKRLVLSGPPHDFRDFVELHRHEVTPEGVFDGVDANTLVEAYERFTSKEKS